MPSTISAGTTSNTALNVSADTSGVLAFQTNGTTTAMTINTSQNVGIGTTSPGQRLQISNPSSSGFAAIRMAADSRSYDVGVGGSASGFQQNNWYVYDVTGAATRLVIDSSGRVTTPFQPGIGIILVNQVFSAAVAGFYKPTTYTTTYDVGGGFNPTGGPSSSFRYTAPIAGRYFIQWSVMGNDGSARMEVCILKNGGDFINGDSNTSKYANAVIASIQYLAANDYLDFRINQGDYYSGVNANPCLSIHLIG